MLYFRLNTRDHITINKSHDNCSIYLSPVNRIDRKIEEWAQTGIKQRSIDRRRRYIGRGCKL